MTGSVEKMTEREAILKAMKTPPVGGYYVWDGVDEDDRPLSEEALRQGLAIAVKKRGRPTGSSNKEQVAIRFDNEVLSAFRSAGPGWQTRMNDALKDWLRTHSAA